MSDDIIPGHIVLFGARVLRTECEPVEVFDEALHRDIDIMAATLKASQGGAALAAPQVSIAKRISVINYMKQYYELCEPGNPGIRRLGPGLRGMPLHAIMDRQG
jgi:peptide deformylase